MTDEFDEEGEDGENGPQGTANGEPISGRDEGSRGADGRFLSSTLAVLRSVGESVGDAAPEFTWDFDVFVGAP